MCTYKIVKNFTALYVFWWQFLLHEEWNWGLHCYYCLFCCLCHLFLYNMYIYIYSMMPLAYYNKPNAQSRDRNFLHHDHSCISILRAYFKKSLQLQRTEKCQTSKHFQILCQKIFHFPKLQISNDLFVSHLQEIFRFHPQKILTTFFFL